MVLPICSVTENDIFAYEYHGGGAGAPCPALSQVALRRVLRENPVGVADHLPDSGLIHVACTPASDGIPAVRRAKDMLDEETNDFSRR